MFEDRNRKKRKICPTIPENKLKSMPYSTRLIIVDRVGFEPTTSARNWMIFIIQLKDRAIEKSIY
jgi:hypothetical protein